MASRKYEMGSSSNESFRMALKEAILPLLPSNPRAGLTLAQLQRVLGVGGELTHALLVRIGIRCSGGKYFR